MSWSGVIYHDKVPAEGWPFPTCIGLGRGRGARGVRGGERAGGRPELAGWRHRFAGTESKIHTV